MSRERTWYRVVEGNQRPGANLYRSSPPASLYVTGFTADLLACKGSACTNLPHPDFFYTAL
ncbi:hypothetical protein [Botryobacter ruber]|uniref:hypothetical protein n=1 Tax=Botryobacter ruber TaxID=2171629 RepID=UPI000FEC55D4|nr:hypothetical protein [Botryobacter ruber]